MIRIWYETGSNKKGIEESVMKSEVHSKKYFAWVVIYTLQHEVIIQLRISYITLKWHSVSEMFNFQYLSLSVHTFDLKGELDSYFSSLVVIMWSHTLIKDKFYRDLRIGNCYWFYWFVSIIQVLDQLGDVVVLLLLGQYK